MLNAWSFLGYWGLKGPGISQINQIFAVSNPYRLGGWAYNEISAFKLILFLMFLQSVPINKGIKRRIAVGQNTDLKFKY